MAAWWRSFWRRSGAPAVAPEAEPRAAVTAETLQLLREALHDPVTGLPEAALLLDRLEIALIRSRRSGDGMALLVVHVEETASLRARLGGTALDDVLREVARRLRGTLRASDTAARYGEIDFAVVCEDLHRNEDLALVAGRIAAALDPPYDVAGVSFGVRASLHLVMPEAGSNALTLLDEMDAALRDAAA